MNVADLREGQTGETDGQVAGSGRTTRSSQCGSMLRCRAPFLPQQPHAGRIDELTSGQPQSCLLTTPSSQFSISAQVDCWRDWLWPAPSRIRSRLGPPSASRCAASASVISRSSAP